MRTRGQHGFTLIEIILVVVAIGILAAVVIVAINPTKQLGDTRNAQRQSNVTTILNAIYQYSIENGGTIPASITATPTEICTTTGATCTSASLIDLGVLFAAEKYLTALPSDPKCPTGCATSGIGYQVAKTTNGRITVSAPSAEQGKTISVTR